MNATPTRRFAVHEADVLPPPLSLPTGCRRRPPPLTLQAAIEGDDAIHKGTQSWLSGENKIWNQFSGSKACNLRNFVRKWRRWEDVRPRLWERNGSGDTEDRTARGDNGLFAGGTRYHYTSKNRRQVDCFLPSRLILSPHPRRSYLCNRRNISDYYRNANICHININKN